MTFYRHSFRLLLLLLPELFNCHASLPGKFIEPIDTFRVKLFKLGLLISLPVLFRSEAEGSKTRFDIESGVSSEQALLSQCTLTSSRRSVTAQQS
jgi:hypothetical protein